MDGKDCQPAANPGRGRVILGLGILAVGVVLLLSRLVEFELELGALWPLIVIGVGLSRFLDEEDLGRRRSGMIIIAVGCWLMINSLGLFHLTYGDSWPLLLVLLGLANLLTPDCRGLGLILLLVGTGFQVAKLDLLDLEMSKIWPIAIIALGVYIVLRAFEVGRPSRHAEVNDNGTP